MTSKYKEQKMKAEKPAEGILKSHDFGDSVFYYVQCDCGNEDCAHTVEVEADDYGVTVHVYTRATTTFWNKGRWRQIWQILTKGYADMETTVILKEQQALNYANALTSAVNDIKVFRAKELAARSKKLT